MPAPQNACGAVAYVKPRWVIIDEIQKAPKLLDVAQQQDESSGIRFILLPARPAPRSSTVQTYFQILEGTLIGFLFEPFPESVRKRQMGNHKFYFLDTGVQRALHQTLDLALKPQTSAFGVAFEHFVIDEIRRLAECAKKDWNYSYFCTKDRWKSILIVEQPGRKRVLIAYRD